MRSVRAKLFTLLLLLSPACATPDQEAPAVSGGEAPLVVATVFPVGDLTAALGGDAVKVEVLLPARASPSTFEPTARQVARLSRTRTYLFVGGGMDPWAENLVGSPQRTPVVRLLEGLRLREGHVHEGDPTSGNPHVWLDPIRVRDELVPRIEAMLVDLDPASENAIRRRGRSLRDSLTALDAEIAGALTNLPSRAFVSTHAAWTYFAERYRLVEVGVVYESPGREPSSRGLALLVERARTAGVRAVFVEPQLGEAGSRAVADELGLEVQMLDPLGGEGLEGRGSYLALMRFNARQIAKALGDGI